MRPRAAGTTATGAAAGRGAGTTTIVMGAGVAAALAAVLAGAAGLEMVYAEPPVSWFPAKGLGVGEEYTYLVCHTESMYQVTYPDPCYTVRLSFLDLINHEAYGTVFVATARYTSGYAAGETVLLFPAPGNKAGVIPATIQDRPLAESLEYILYGIIDGGVLRAGAIWGEKDTYHHSVPVVVVRDPDSDGPEGSSTYDIEYDYFATSTIRVHASLPFPIEGDVYDVWYPFDEPRRLAYFRLLSP